MGSLRCSHFLGKAHAPLAAQQTSFDFRNRFYLSADPRQQKTGSLYSFYSFLTSEINFCFSHRLRTPERLVLQMFFIYRILPCRVFNRRS